MLLLRYDLKKPRADCKRRLIVASIRPQKFAHVVYRTHRYEEMLTWYQTVFDAKLQHYDPVIAFLTYDDEHHRLAFINLGEIKPDSSETEKKGLVGVDHVAYTYSSPDDLFDNYEQLKEQGITPYWCVHHGITVSMYYKDPDANQMEFQVDCFESADEAVQFMTGPIFHSNPVGVEYDPDDWLAKKRAGEELSQLLKMQKQEPKSPIRGALGE
jgi:catechol-2,3-dioxygenase